jgi:Helicase HerA, central domain
MPTVDLVQSVKSAIERNIGIPAVLDAYGEFVDSPIGPLELQHLDEVFSFILSNLSERFPKVAAAKAAQVARSGIDSFLAIANNNVDRVKEVLRGELRTAGKTIIQSIGERFSKMSPEERRAIDATLRLIRSSPEDIIFKVERGKPLESSGAEFRRFFAGVKAESPSIRELRYQNLIVEKGVFNRLLLKSKNQNFSIWVPSLFAKENLEELIVLCGVRSEHILLSHLKDLSSQGDLEKLRPLLQTLIENQGILSKTTAVPQELASYLHEVGDSLLAMEPIDLDDISLFMREEQELELHREREQEESRRREEEARAAAEESRAAQFRQRVVSQAVVLEERSMQQSERTGESILLGKKLDLEQFIDALGKRIGESEMASKVKSVGDYYLESPTLMKRGVAIIGASGSGRSTTLRRILDGAASLGSSHTIIVIDQKGEHRGIAWKYKWKVFAFAADSQATQFRLQMIPAQAQAETSSIAESFADLIQEWCLESGVACSEENRARIASLVRAKLGESAHDLEAILAALSSDPDLAQVGQKLSKNLLSKGMTSRIFSADKSFELAEIKGGLLFDISGRGLRDPTTKEERLIVLVLLLELLLSRQIQNSLIVVEDAFDRFKSDSLRRRTAELVRKLRERNNAIVTTSRSQVREFTGNQCLEIVHRLFGEKTIAEELKGFRTAKIRGLESNIAFLPRGYAFVSSVLDAQGNEVPSCAVKIEPVRFSGD